jgi:hypothetical protein
MGDVDVLPALADRHLQVAAYRILWCGTALNWRPTKSLFRNDHIQRDEGWVRFGFAERMFWNIGRRSANLVGSLRLNVGSPDNFRPLVGFIGDQLAEFGGRKHKRRATQVGESPCYLGIGEARIDLLVELADDLGCRVLGCAKAKKGAGFVARQELGQARDIDPYGVAPDVQCRGEALSCRPPTRAG